MMLELKKKKLRTGKGKGIGKHSKGTRYLGVSGKGKGKRIRPQKKITKQKVTPPSTVVAKKDNQQLVPLHDLVCMF